MARLFDDAATQFLERSGAVVTATPLTLACWFQTDDLAADQTLLQLGGATTSDQHAIYVLGGTAGDPVLAYSESPSAAANSQIAGTTLNTWHHAAGVFVNTTSRTAYLDGTAGTTNTTSVFPSGLDTTSIGRSNYASTAFFYLSGRVAEAAIWNVALDANDIASLARGFSPLFVRPFDLVAYWPLVGRSSPEPDLVGAFDLTVTGATQAEHTRIVYPTVAQVYHVAAAAAADARRLRQLLGVGR